MPQDTSPTMATTMYPRSTPKLMSVEEFLAFYEKRPEGEHWELIDGEAIMMTPPTKVHDRVGDNLARALNNHFERARPEFHAYQGAGLIVPEVDRFRPEADVSVEGAIADYESYNDTFYLAAEVISDSNTAKQIAINRKHYAAHPDNHYCLTIAQKKVSVEVRARASGWKPVVLTKLDDELELPEFGFSMSLAALYAGTPLAKA
jgi:Uma2 family endonuclease